MLVNKNFQCRLYVSEKMSLQNSIFMLDQFFYSIVDVYTKVQSDGIKLSIQTQSEQEKQTRK